MSLRKQEITDHLNAWIIFDEKNKELCDWLTQVENKWEDNSDLNVEEMVEKLEKVSLCVRGSDLMSCHMTRFFMMWRGLINWVSQ